jgi:predicted signal transduction protein with EAL and GGDEF domain
MRSNPVPQGFGPLSPVTIMGGDEFALIAGQLAKDSEPCSIAARLLATLQEEPFGLSGQTVRVSASIGVSLFPRDGADATA